MRRIGIYAGTFDPVHAGHIAFALAAIGQAALSSVYFLPERQPRHKPHVTEYVLRLTGLEQALTTYEHLEVVELPEHILTVHETLPELEQKFPVTKLTLLVGADVLAHMAGWPQIEQLIETCDFVIGMREGYDMAATIGALQQLGISQSHYTIVQTDQSHVTSSGIRAATN